MKRKAIIFLVLMFCVGVAFSEENRKESIFGKTIDETVSPFKYLLTPSQRLDPIVITPSRYAEPSLDVSRNVTNIDQEEISKSYARYAPELLRDQSGVLVSDLLGNGKAVNVDIGGFGEMSALNTLVLVNGRRTNQVDLSGTDWAQINVDSVERIEIVRGSQSVLYGDNATGGAVNIITKTGAGKKPAIGFKYKNGSYNYNSYSGFVEGGTRFMDYFIDIAQSDTNGYRTNNGLETGDLNGNITVKPADNFRIKFEGGYHKDWYGQPGALFPSDINSVGWRGTVFPNSKAKTIDGYLMATPEFKTDAPFGDLLLYGDIQWRDRRTAALSYFRDGSSSEQNGRVETFGVTPKAAFTVDYLGIRNRLIAGIDCYVNKNEISSTHFDFSWLTFTSYANGEDRIIINKDTVGLYVTDMMELFSKLIVNAGYRAEWANYKFDQKAMTSGVNKNNPFEYAADAGIDYKYNEKSSIYTSYSRSFRFPVTDEWYQSLWKDDSGLVHGGLNMDLRPQTTNSYEIGIKDNSSKYIGFKADYFIMDTRHELIYNPIIYSNALYDQTMRNGLELEVHAYLLDGFDCFSNYTYEKAHYVGGMFAGNALPMVPNNKFSWGFNYRFKDCVDFNYKATFVGARYFINDEFNKMPPLKSYFVNDIKLSYYKHGLKIYGAMHNIFNEKYSEYGTLNSSFTKPAYYPSPGMNYEIGVEYKF